MGSKKGLGESAAYAVWLACVDRNIKKRVGLTHSPKDDAVYQLWYSEGFTPGMAAVEAVKCAALIGSVGDILDN